MKLVIVMEDGAIQQILSGVEGAPEIYVIQYQREGGEDLPAPQATFDEAGPAHVQIARPDFEPDLVRDYSRKINLAKVDMIDNALSVRKPARPPEVEAPPLVFGSGNF
jgi:hypothetical protein